MVRSFGVTVKGVYRFEVRSQNVWDYWGSRRASGPAMPKKTLESSAPSSLEQSEVYANAITPLDAGYSVAVESLSYLAREAEYIKADAKELMSPDNYEELQKRSSTRALVKA